MRSIEILSNRDVIERVRQLKSVAVLSIEHPRARNIIEGRAPRLLVEEGMKHVFQRIQVYWDTEEDHVEGPSKRDVRSGLTFLRRHAKRNRPLIVHCRQGKARSAAMALAYLVEANPDETIEACINHLKAIRPQAAPNIKVVQYADELLGKNGALVAAVLADMDLSANREAANASRARYAEKNPRALPQLKPQKRGPKPKQP